MGGPRWGRGVPCSSSLRWDASWTRHADRTRAGAANVRRSVAVCTSWRPRWARSQKGGFTCLMSLRFWRRRGSVSVEMDEQGVRRVRGGKILEAVEWAELDEVAIWTTSEGPATEDVYFVLRGVEDRGVVVPSEAAPEGLLERLQQLPGFDSGKVIEAMGSVEEAVFVCWRST
jgi:hypothetical protein